MEFYQNSKRVVVLVTIATVIIGFLWGLFSLAPSAVRIAFSVLMILSIIVFPYGLIRKNDFDRFPNVLLRMILALSIVAVLRSVFNENADMHAVGNKWLTLFGNEYCSLIFLPPLFTYLATIPLNIALVKKINYQYMLLGALCILLFKYPLASLVIWLPIFVPYVNRNYKMLIMMAMLEAVICAVTGENPTRAYFLYIAFSFLAYLFVYVIKKNNITRVFCVGCIVLPFVLFFPMMLSKNNNNLSFFQKAQATIINETKNSELATDTRTFLYREMAYDLTKTESWVWGKGAYAHYYSFSFDQGINGKYGRMTSEVPFLNFLMHGGIVYTALYFLLLVYAVYNGLWKGNNKFVQCIAVVATGWYFCSFICDLTGARYYHMVFFILLGCCFSRRFLSMSDEEISLLFDEGIAV